MSGRPIRFLGATLVGWVAVRAFMLWPAAVPAAIPRAIAPIAFDRKSFVAPTVAPSQPLTIASEPPQSQSVSTVPLRSIAGPGTLLILNSRVESVAPTTPVRAADPAPPPQSLLMPPPAIARPANKAESRWSASAWFVLRDGRGIAPGLSGGQLGGSQAGLRIAYAIGDARRVAIVGRVATPLKGQGREAAVGIEWRPTALPVRIVAEYRVALDGGASGPAAGIIAGTGPAPVAFGFDLETYAQAGLIRRRRAEPYAEGAARLSRRFLSVGNATVDLGLGGWGGAQRGAERLDVGPSLGVRLPVLGTAIRASLDWRQRVAGGARPGSGPVLVIGGDF